MADPTPVTRSMTEREIHAFEHLTIRYLLLPNLSLNHVVKITASRISALPHQTRSRAKGPPLYQPGATPQEIVPNPKRAESPNYASGPNPSRRGRIPMQAWKEPYVNLVGCPSGPISSSRHFFAIRRARHKTSLKLCPGMRKLRPFLIAENISVKSHRRDL